MALRLEGRPVAREVLAGVRAKLADLATQHACWPSASAVLVGEDPSSLAYLAAIGRTFDRLGLNLETVRLPGRIDVDHLAGTIHALNQDPGLDGIIVLQPLPKHLPAGIAASLLAPEKDIDGVTSVNAGRLAVGLATFVPSTPAGGMAILDYYGIDPNGLHCVVIGRSPVVGRPMAAMLLAADGTVTICHSRTRDLSRFTREADIVALAAGHAGLLTGDMIKPGATVIDFGVNLIDNRIVGDADPSVWEVAGAVTPVPGGTGIVTNAILVRQLVEAAQRRVKLTAGASA